MATQGTRRTGSQAVERALGLLRSFEVGPPTRSLSELAQLTGLTPATAHRLLRALCCAELLAHDPLTERYGLGVALVPLGSRAADALGVSAVRPLLESLAATTGESVNLGVRDGGDVLVLLGVPSAQNLRFDQGAGTRVPAYASAMGKVLLAFDPDPAEAVHSVPRLTKLTGSTITSRSVLSRVLEETRRSGLGHQRRGARAVRADRCRAGESWRRLRRGCGSGSGAVVADDRRPDHKVAAQPPSRGDGRRDAPFHAEVMGPGTHDGRPPGLTGPRRLAGSEWPDRLNPSERPRHHEEPEHDDD